MKTAVLEERVNNMIVENTKEHQTILTEIGNINTKLDKMFVKKDEFTPVRNIVYGAVGLILTTVMGWFLFLVATHKII